MESSMTAHPNLSAIRSATLAPLHVIVIGGGIGGLTLTQGLKKSGVSVAVYERDRTPSDRVQGYRVHINLAGSLALHECLPPHLFDAFARTCGKRSGGIRFMTEQMKVLLLLDLADVPQFAEEDSVAQHRSVSRITLRQVLLSELDDVVHFGKTFTHYEESATGRVIAHFEDGTSAEGDVLVAADGGGSRVRRQFLPNAQRVDTGVVGIAGKVFLDETNRRRLPPELLGGMRLVSAQGITLFVALQDLSGDRVGDIGGNDTAAEASAHFDNTSSYLMWALGGRRATLGLDGDMDAFDGASLRAIALQAMAGWDERLKTLVHLAHEDTINALVIRTSVPVAAWPTRRITLLGDAIHAMTPYRGIGANVALKDAVRLSRVLVAANRGERPLIEEIRGYEDEMREYGFRAVRTSLRAMEQAIPQNRARLSVSRAIFRTIDRLPPLKRWMFSNMGDE
jgi:salicylate hydroxylase